MSTQAESPSFSPEELLRHLELETLRHRTAREVAGRQRLLVLSAGLIFVIAAAVGALLFLFSMLRDLPHAERAVLHGVPASFRDTLRLWA